MNRLLSHDVAHPIVLKVNRTTLTEFTPSRNANTIYLDIKALDNNHKWAIRHWHEGDRMTPFGMKGSKKLSDIFNDAKLPLKDKKRVWLLTCDEKIVWIIGIRASNLFKITDATTDIIKITYIPD